MGISVHGEPAAINQTHRAMITVSAGLDGITENAIQAGWMVTIITHFLFLFFL